MESVPDLVRYSLTANLLDWSSTNTARAVKSSKAVLADGFCPTPGKRALNWDNALFLIAQRWAS